MAAGGGTVNYLQGGNYRLGGEMELGLGCAEGGMGEMLETVQNRGNVGKMGREGLELKGWREGGKGARGIGN